MMIGAIIQARIGSTRLPGKAMMNVDEKNPILFYVINQLRYSKLLDKVVIATTDLKEDDKIVEYVRDLNMDYFRGSSTDVLDRYYKCAKKFSFSTIVRITSDDPLVDPTIIDKAIRKFSSNSYDFVTNCFPRTFPQGTEVEVFSLQALEEAWHKSKTSVEREHVTTYFYSNPNDFKIFNVMHSENISHLRWTIDRMPDFKLVKIIVSKIKKRPILMIDILDLLSKEPNLISINKDYIIDEAI